ncbi:hypothetical protein Tco_0091303 [Tanacetum coccineum]
METRDLVDTPMVEKSKLDEDPQGKAVDLTRCRGIISTLMYFTSSIPGLVFVVYMCSRYQAKPTEKHLHAVKRIFRYLRGTINICMWYSKDSCIALTAFTDVDHVGCQDTRKRAEYIALSGCLSLLYASTTSNTSGLSTSDITLSNEQVDNGVVELYFVRTEYRLADIFTKHLARERLEFLINKLGMRSMSPKTLKQLAVEEED